MNIEINKLLCKIALQNVGNSGGRQGKWFLGSIHFELLPEENLTDRLVKGHVSDFKMWEGWLDFLDIEKCHKILTDINFAVLCLKDDNQDIVRLARIRTTVLAKSDSLEINIIRDKFYESYLMARDFIMSNNCPKIDMPKPDQTLE